MGRSKVDQPLQGRHAGRAHDGHGVCGGPSQRALIYLPNDP
jgi:hypothetical protein